VELLLVWVGISLFLWLVRVISRAGEPAPARTPIASPKTPPLTRTDAKMSMRLTRAEVQGSQHPFIVVRAELRGFFALLRPVNLRFVTSILDVTEQVPDGKRVGYPVISRLERFREPGTTCFMARSEVLRIGVNQMLADWSAVAEIIPETLLPPRAGRRTIAVAVYLVDDFRPIEVQTGFIVAGKPLKSFVQEFEWDFSGEGYLDRSQRLRQVEILMVELAVAMAFADGEFADAEGQAIRDWAAQRLAMLDEGERESTKADLNAAMARAFQKGKQGSLDIARVAADLCGVTEVSERLDAVELCLRVMAADNVVEDRELARVNDVAKLLEVDVERFRELKDKRLAFSTHLEGSLDPRALLGIEPDWDKDRIRTHLNQLYGQWNGRAEALGDPEKRAQAEKMIDIIATARSELLDARPPGEHGS
jgi:uncharacterized tellurite resistance protein B-like protein